MFTKRSQRSRCLPAVTAIGAALLAHGALAPDPVYAHFILQAPACYADQDIVGSPQKSAPCGQADPGTPIRLNGAVTTFREGQTITLTIKEVVAHPGHYRVSIADKPSDLPADPPVTAGTTPCGSTVIDPMPKLPLLADGLLVHTSAFTMPQSVSVQLPPGLTCTNCTLQVTEFMSNHPLNNPGGCFYHHCATVNIVPATDGGTSSDGGMSMDGGSGGPDGSMISDAGPATDGGGPVDAATGPVDAAASPVDAATGSPDAAVPPLPPPGGGGCGITAASAAGLAPLSGLLTLALLLLRRRSRA